MQNICFFIAFVCFAPALVRVVVILKEVVLAEMAACAVCKRDRTPGL